MGQKTKISHMIHSIEILVVNTICIRGNMGNPQISRIFFVAFVGADHNRWLWNYVKITQFTILVRGGRVMIKSFERLQEEGGYQNPTSANKAEKESRFWSFYDNKIIECHPATTPPPPQLPPSPLTS